MYEMYDSTKVKLLKVYMVTKCKTTDADLPSLPAKKKARITKPPQSACTSTSLQNDTPDGDNGVLDTLNTATATGPALQ